MDLGISKNISSALVIVLYFYDIQNEVSLDRGTFRVLDLPPTTPTCFGEGGGGDTPKNVKKYFRRLQKHMLKNKSESFKN